MEPRLHCASFAAPVSAASACRKAPSPPSLRGGRAGQDQVVILDDDQPGSLGLVSRSRTP
jgi:hypothetical protein